MSDYFSDPRINASTLKLFSGRDFSPALALHKLRNPSAPSAAMQLGTAVHSYLEHKGQFGPDVLISPFDSFRTKEAQQWKKDNDGKIILTNDEAAKAFQMGENIRTLSPEPILSMIHSPDAEVEKECYTPRFKAKLDLICNGAGIDYKTTNATNAAQFVRDCNNYGYALQAAFYCMVAGLSDFYFVAVSSAEPHEVFAFKCGKSYLQWGDELVVEALKRYNTWKDVEIVRPELLTLEAPAWAEVELVADEAEDVF